MKVKELILTADERNDLVEMRNSLTRKTRERVIARFDYSSCEIATDDVRQAENWLKTVEAILNASL